MSLSLTEFVSKPRYVTMWLGLRTDLMGWMTNINLQKMSNEVLTILTHSSSETPINKVLSMKIVEINPKL